MTSRKDNSAASSKVCPEAIDEAALQHPSPGQSGLSFYEKSKYSNPSFLDRSIPTTKVPTLARTFLPIHPIRKVRPEYLTQTESPPRRLEAPQKLLVILDLNGTLFYKNKNTKAYTSRPFLDNFNEFLFTHFTVMVWSSARPESVGKMVEKGFGEHVKDLDRIWSRDFFGLHEADYHRRVLTVKDLEYVWNEMRRKQQQQQQEQQQISGSKDGGMQGAEDGVHGNVGSSAESPEGQHMGTPPPHAIPTTYDQTNTVIIDDSKEKTQLQPFNRLLIKEFVGEKDDIALLQVVAYLKEAMYYDNVSSFIRHHPFTTSVASQTDLVRSLFAECRINAKQMGLELPETNKQAGEQRKAKKKKKRRQQEPTQHVLDTHRRQGQESRKQQRQQIQPQFHQHQHRQAQRSEQCEQDAWEKPYQRPTIVPPKAAPIEMRHERSAIGNPKRKHRADDQQDGITMDAPTVVHSTHKVHNGSSKSRHNDRQSFHVGSGQNSDQFMAVMREGSENRPRKRKLGKRDRMHLQQQRRQGSEEGHNQLWPSPLTERRGFPLGQVVHQNQDLGGAAANQQVQNRVEAQW